MPGTRSGWKTSTQDNVENTGAKSDTDTIEILEKQLSRIEGKMDAFNEFKVTILSAILKK